MKIYSFPIPAAMQAKIEGNALEEKLRYALDAPIGVSVSQAGRLLVHAPDETDAVAIKTIVAEHKKAMLG